MVEFSSLVYVGRFFVKGDARVTLVKISPAAFRYSIYIHALGLFYPSAPSTFRT